MTVVIMEQQQQQKTYVMEQQQQQKNCSWISGTHWNVRLLQNALAKPPNSLLFSFPAFSIL